MPGRPAGGLTRPGGNAPGRPAGGVTRPATPDRPNIGGRPNRPNRPETLPGGLPGGTYRPGPSNRPTTRPGVANRPGRPDGAGPGTTRPIPLPGEVGGYRPGGGGAGRPPGAGGGGRPGGSTTLPGEIGLGPGNRPGTGGRPPWGGNRPGMGGRPPWGGNYPGSGGNRPWPGDGNINIGNSTRNRPAWGVGRGWGGRWGGNWVGSNWGGGWHGNRRPIVNNFFFGPAWSGANWGNWYRGRAGGFWAGFGTAALTSWGINALFRPTLAYRSLGFVPAAWGAPVYGSWGLGSVASGWMYPGYTNPYVTPASQTVVVQQPVPVPVEGGAVPPAQQVVAYDYADPINVAAEPPEPAVAESAQKVFESARDSFQSGDYGRALALADQALVMLPDDPALHEFRGLALFALKRYAEAAAVTYAVLSAGPGWDWATLAGLYPSVDAYTDHLRALEAYAKRNPTEAAPRFLLAYLYLVQGNEEEAAAQFSNVARLQPDDRLSAKLAETLAPDAEQAFHRLSRNDCL